MTDGVDYYDVQRMVEAEASQRRAAVNDLREEIARERTERREAEEALREEIGALRRVLDARTGHLV